MKLTISQLKTKQMQQTGFQLLEDEEFVTVELDKKREKFEKLMKENPNKVAVLIELAPSSKRLKSIKKLKYDMSDLGFSSRRRTKCLTS